MLGGLFAERKAKLLARFVVGEVKLQRRDRDAPRLHGPEVGAFRRPAFAALDADPVIRLAASIEPVLDAEIVGIALTLAGYHHALDRAWAAVGKIDVEHHALAPAGLEQLPQERRTMAHRRFPFRRAGLVLADGEAERDRGY